MIPVEPTRRHEDADPRQWQTESARLKAQIGELRQAADRLRAEQARAGQELDRLRRAAISAEASAEAQRQELRDELEQFRASPGWRATAPLRRMLDALTPRQRHSMRRLLKAGYWAATPWRIPARLRFLQARKEALSAAPAPATASPITPPLAVAPGYEDWARGAAPRAANPGRPPTVQPLVTFLIADADRRALSTTLASLAGQSWDCWEAVIHTLRRDALEEVMPDAASGGSDRVSVLEGGGHDGASGMAAALDRARGEFVAVLTAGDVLAPAALDEIGAALDRAPHLDILYSDEDQRSPADVRQAPYLKPSWSPELLRSFNYFGRLTLLRTSLVREAGGFDAEAGAATEWDANLRVAELARTSTRIPRILCHRAPDSDRDRPDPASPAAADARAVLARYWRRQGIDATVVTGEDGLQAASWPLPREPLVSVVIPTRDGSGRLAAAVSGILQRTDYRNLELVIVDAGSKGNDPPGLDAEARHDGRVRILRHRSSFSHASACNSGAAAARGEILLFLSDGIEVTSRDWLAEMVRHAVQPGVGCVGTGMVSPSLEPRGAGLAIGTDRVAPMFGGAQGASWDISGSPAHDRNCMAIEGPCQMVSREAFDAVGGFDEAYEGAMGGVALCLQVWRAGYRTVYAPRAGLIHHEGATGDQADPADDIRRLADDIRFIGLGEDPYLHPELDVPSGTPVLRAPGADGAREDLRGMLTAFASWPVPPVELDLVDTGKLLAGIGASRDEALWAPQPACRVTDKWSAARWIIDLLRRRADLRARFPDALSGGAEAPFVRWLLAEGMQQFGLPPAAAGAVREAFAEDLGGRARRVFFWHADLRQMWPHGLTPAGGPALFGWFVRHGLREEGLRLEEIWWLFWAARERPGQEVVRAFLFTPAWQAMFPDGATPFGADRFGRWFAAHYRVDGPWLDASRWTLPGSAADQIRSAWRVREHWRMSHPDVAGDGGAARRFLAWLASGEAPMEPWVRRWLAGLEVEAVAAELSRPGLNMLAHFRYPSGLRISAEALVKGLDQIGVGTSLRDVRTDQRDDTGHEAFDGVETYDITVIHTQPQPFFEAAYARTDLAEQMPRTYRIGYWYWEFDTVPESWQQQAALVDEVWTATDFVADALRKRLSIPVRTLFPGVELAAFEARGRAYFDLPENETTFLFAFHMASVMERKNPLGLIRAFGRAFRPEEPARLVIKTSFGHSHPTQLATLKAAAEGARITIIDEIYSPNDVLALMETCDAYISLHRSEGLGLTMAEAMLLGKPVIATAFSGNMAFTTPQNSLLVDYELVKLGMRIPPYDENYEWAEPSEEQAAAHMRRIFDDRGFARELGARALADGRDRLSLATAARRVRARLEEIRALRTEPAPSASGQDG